MCRGRKGGGDGGALNELISVGGEARGGKREKRWLLLCLIMLVDTLSLSTSPLRGLRQASRIPIPSFSLILSLPRILKIVHISKEYTCYGI